MRGDPQHRADGGLISLDHGRLSLLQRLSEGLAGLTFPSEVASTILQHAADGLELDAGSLWSLSEDRQSLELAAHYGYPSEVLADWQSVGLDCSTPLGACASGQIAMYLERHEMLQRYPQLARRASTMNRSIVLLPLVVHDGELVAVLVLGSFCPREFSAQDRLLLEAIARQSAMALDRATTRVALENARRAAEFRQAQLAFLAEASDALGRSLELRTVLSTVASLAVPRIADRCVLYLQEGKDVVQSMLAPEPSELERELLARLEPAPEGVAEVLAGGSPLHLERVEVDPSESELNAELARVGVGGVLVLPLTARGRRLGALAFVNRHGRNLDDSDRLLAEELAARASVAIDNAKLFARESEVAHKLARSLLPDQLPRIDGLELVARYIPGGTGFEVGGDFYDCVKVGPRAHLIVVGDVQGRGIEAAALTGLARYTIQSYVAIDPRPSAALSHLNSVLVRRGPDGSTSDLDLERPRFCTAMLMLIEQSGAGFSLRIASGGHPLPLLRHRDGSVEQLGRSNMMLGCSEDATYSDTRATLLPGELVVSVTDGITERRTATGLFGAEGVSALIANSASSEPNVLADRLVNAARTSANAADDVVVVVVSASDRPAGDEPDDS